MATKSNFKTFLKQRKREYSLQFPFLTDNQIVAKLRRIWGAARAKTLEQPGPTHPAKTVRKEDRAIVRRNLSILASESLLVDKLVEQRKGSNKRDLSPCSITTDSISAENLNLAGSHDLTYGENRNEFHDSIECTCPNKCGCVHLPGTLDAHTEPDHKPSPLAVCIGCVPNSVKDSSLYLSSRHVPTMTICNEAPVCLPVDNTVSEFPCTEAAKSRLDRSDDLVTDTWLEMNNKCKSSSCLDESIPSSSVSLLRHVGSTTPHHGNLNHTVQNQCLPRERRLLTTVCCELTEHSSRTATRKKRKRDKLQTNNSQPDSHPVVRTDSCFNTSSSSLPAELARVPGGKNRKTKRQRNSYTSDPSVPARITRSRAVLLREQENIIDYCELPPIKKKRKVQDYKNSSQKTVSLGAKRKSSGESLDCSMSTITSSLKAIGPGCDLSETATLPSNTSTPTAQLEVRSQPKTSSPFQPFAQCTTTPSPNIERLLSPVRENVLCDMFLPLTPDRRKYDFYQTVPSFFSGATLERRVFRSAVSTRADVSNYCMFADNADIFM